MHWCCALVRYEAADTDLIRCWFPLHDLPAEVMAVPEALDDDIQEAVILSSGVAQAHY